MLTAIEIENFKGIGARQRIELKPITLLFGPNSGGKSTVLHALHYLREVITFGNLDVHRTWSGGDALDLGGIRQFVHGQRYGQPIRLRAEFTLSGSELPDYRKLRTPDDQDEDEERIRGLVSTASIDLEIDTDGKPLLSTFAVSLNGEPFARFTVDRGKPHATVQRINWLHSLVLADDDDREAADVGRELHQLFALRKEILSRVPATEELARVMKEIEGHAKSPEVFGTLAPRFPEPMIDDAANCSAHRLRTSSVHADMRHT